MESEERTGPFPFCSWRCKKLDLHRWLNEEYRISEPAALAFARVPEGDYEGDSGKAPV